MVLALAILQTALAALVFRRLASGRHRRVAEAPRPEGIAGAVTVVVPTLNEAARIGPCLRGLQAQGAPVQEILVVDSGSSDGTQQLVRAAAAHDARIRLLADPPLPSGWIGKAWALQYALEQAQHEWVLGMDADTEALPGCAAAVLAAAERESFDVVSFAPRFAGQSRAERLVQPALLVTLIYRLGAAGEPRVRAERVMANGQCFLARRDTVRRHGGYEAVRTSFAEDVSLARHLATRGVRVGFLDGSQLYRVRAYSGVAQMWREWGRSLDLKDATHPVRQAWDAMFVLLAQGLQLPLAIALVAQWHALPAGGARVLLASATVALLGVRWSLLLALAPSYAERGVTWWLSPLADLPAAVRLIWSSVRRPRRWRSREYR